MAKLWAGRNSGQTAQIADDFNSSIKIDKRMYRQDILGSIAHATMLGECGIISKADSELICKTLGEILDEISSGRLLIDETCEDIHMYVEQELTSRIGDAGKKVHTARSRNDQVALDIRMYLKQEADEIIDKCKTLIKAVTDLAENNKTIIMPGYTHLQRAQPILFSHQILAYGMMLTRDISRLNDCKKRMNQSPIGSCALAGTTYNTNRYLEAELLSFDGITLNSIDGVSDRDFIVEMISTLSIIMMHLSRFAEEIILWSSSEFSFIDLDDNYTTGSSIMPQKKNPDMAELVRGKTGRVYGDLIAILTIMKGIPLAYNKDMQEDKETVFDAVDTVKLCLDIFTGMIGTVKVNSGSMRTAASKGFINATDLADYLVKKGMPFRDAYKVSGKAVAYCISNGLTLETMSLAEYKKLSERFEDDLYDAINLEHCVETRISEGGTSLSSVEKQIEFLKDYVL